MEINVSSFFFFFDELPNHDVVERVLWREPIPALKLGPFRPMRS